jgi:hypothetical protein
VWSDKLDTLPRLQLNSQRQRHRRQAAHGHTPEDRNAMECDPVVPGKPGIEALRNDQLGQSN